VRRKEQGFSLISVVVASAIGALVVLGAGMTTMQIIRGTEGNEELSEVVRQAQNLGRWFSRDALMAANITAGDNPGTGDDELLTISWKDWESGDTYDIRYIWFDYVDSLKQIKRNQVMRDKDGYVVEDVTSLLACGIYSANVSEQADIWTLNVDACAGDRHAVREYKITQRLN
jgi:type II secretory pathway pseudopilin PulG